jgi:hypothetical protein
MVPLVVGIALLLLALTLTGLPAPARWAFAVVGVVLLIATDRWLQFARRFGRSIPGMCPSGS